MRVNWLNFGLLGVALLLFGALAIPGIAATLLVSVVRWPASGGPVVYLSRAAGTIAISIDVMGNVMYKDLLEVLFLKHSNPHPFGKVGETISYVLGKNKQLGTLSRTGRLLADLLNRIDPEHVEKAVRIHESKRGAVS